MRRLALALALVGAGTALAARPDPTPAPAKGSPVNLKAAIQLERREDNNGEIEQSLLAVALALEAGDEVRAAKYLGTPFAADPLPGTTGKPEEVHAGFTRAPLAGGAAPVTSPADWVHGLAAWLGECARVEEVRFDLRESKDENEAGEMPARFALHAQGVMPDGSRRALSAELSAVLKFTNEKFIIHRMKLEAGEVLACAHPPFLEVSLPAGVAKITRAFATDEDVDWNWQGACAIDVDGDGWIDLFVPSKPANHLFRNQGDGTFADVARAWGVDQPAGGTGALALDFDNDGKDDLFVCAAGKSLRLFHNDGKRFVDVTARAGLERVSSAASACAADYDGDGFLDVFVACYKPVQEIGPNSWHDVTNGGPSLLFHNRGDGTFEEVAAKAGLAAPRFSFAAAWGDYDDDGKPDLAVANDYGDKALYHNLGGGTFEEVAAKLGVNDVGNGMGVDWGDADGDGKLDLWFANMSSVVGERIVKPLMIEPVSGETRRVLDLLDGNALFLGDGKTFRDVRREAGIADAGWAWGGGFIDTDGDGKLDLFVANGMISGRTRRDTDSMYWTHVTQSSLPVPLREKPSNEIYVERHHSQVLKGGWSFAGFQRDHLFLNNGNARFVDVSPVSGCDGVQDGRSAVFADFDNDGRPDIFVHEISGNRHRLYANVGPQPAKFLSLALEGVKDNRNAVGARVRATLSGAGGPRTLTRWVMAGSGYASSGDRRVLIPVPAGDKLDAVEIRWPGGAVQKLEPVPDAAFVTVRQGEAAKTRAVALARLGRGSPAPAVLSSAGGAMDAGDLCPALQADFVPGYKGGPVQLAGKWSILTLLDPASKDSAAELAALIAKPAKVTAVGLFASPPPPGQEAKVPLAVATPRWLARVFGRSPHAYPTALLVDPYGQIFARRDGPGCTRAVAALADAK